MMLFIGGLVSWNLYFNAYLKNDTVNIYHFPKQIGDWKGEDVPVSEDDYAILETRNVLARIYTSGEKKVYLLMVYSQHNRKAFHPPEICYLGGGVSIVEKKPLSLQIDRGTTISANRLLLEWKGNTQYAYYWFKIGNSFLSNYWKQQIKMVFNILTGRPHSSALIRLSANITERRKKEAIHWIHEFIYALTPYLLKHLP